MIVFQMDNTGRIHSYDGSISELGAAVDPSSWLKRAAFFRDHAIIADLAVEIASNLKLLTNSVITQICNTEAAMCLGPNDQYATVSSCTSFMNSIRYGSWDDMTQHNTVTCRLLHLLLVPLRPEVHCFHIGPDGGGKCHDIPEKDFYLFNLGSGLQSNVAG